ncbi:MAG: hypothetical protein ACRDE2_14900, partial [Chitinophagaceae bacterium]
MTLADVCKRGSFTGIGAHWILSNNFLTPSAYKIRKIRDRGSIKDSIINSDINLFDREVVDINNKSFQGIKRAVALLGIFIFVAPLGGVWHLGNCVYHTVLWIKKGEKPAYLKEHISSLIIDLVWTLFTYAIAYDLLKAQPSFWKLMLSDKVKELTEIGRLVYAVIFIAYIVFSLVAGCLIMFGAHTLSDSRKPFYLKEQFGIVGENGWLLTIDQELDTEKRIPCENSDEVTINGHFYDIWKEQAMKVLLEAEE